jgi:hypothetical protein
MLPISRYGRYGPLGPDDPNNSQPFMSAPCLLQEQGGLAPVQQSTIPTSSAFLVGPVDNTPPPLLRLVGRSVRRARDGVILKSTTNSGGLL